MESYDYDSIPLLALVAAVVVALIAHPARTSRLAMTSAPVSILAALVLLVPPTTSTRAGAGSAALLAAEKLDGLLGLGPLHRGLALCRELNLQFNDGVELTVFSTLVTNGGDISSEVRGHFRGHVAGTLILEVNLLGFPPEEVSSVGLVLVPKDHLHDLVEGVHSDVSIRVLLPHYFLEVLLREEEGIDRMAPQDCEAVRRERHVKAPLWHNARDLTRPNNPSGELNVFYSTILMDLRSIKTVPK